MAFGYPNPRNDKSLTKKDEIATALTRFPLEEAKTFHLGRNADPPDSLITKLDEGVFLAPDRLAST